MHSFARKLRREHTYHVLMLYISNLYTLTENPFKQESLQRMLVQITALYTEMLRKCVQ